MSFFTGKPTFYYTKLPLIQGIKTIYKGFELYFVQCGQFLLNSLPNNKVIDLSKLK